MSNIKMLPNNVINQIAAGEVIERPASIVKELVENSIDAYADAITIAIKSGGIEEIIVKDNGIGMTKEELKMAFVRHATSKVFNEEDLTKIATLGFRGEALPSIAAVSTVEAKSKIENNIEGYNLQFEYGNLVKEGVVATKTGTDIKVSNLFKKIPARKKFIGTPRGESQRITDIFQNLAFSHPHISFSYYRDDNLIVKTLGDGKITNTAAMILGNEFSKNSLTISYIENEYKVTGLITKPTFNQASRKKQFFFVNNRAIEDSSITHALEYGYGNLIPNGRFPHALLFIKTPLEDVDVNVHPSKKEVRFSNKSFIHSIVVKAVKEALLKQSTATSINIPEIQNKPNEINKDNSKVNTNHEYDHNQREINYEKVNFTKNDSNKIKEGIDFFINTEETSERFDVRQIKVFDNISILGQIHNSFIVFQNRNGLGLIDQHAAHERIIYDKLTKRKETWYKQKFAVPMKLSFTNLISDIIREYISELEIVGFEIETFGRNSFIVRAIPNFLVNKLNHGELKEILSDIFNNKTKIEDWYEKLLIDISCKAAIKIKQNLNKEEIFKLIQDLAMSDNWQYCPHGRPTVLEISFSELEKMFKRT